MRTTARGTRPVILRSIIALAHDLGMEVVAEGAETDSDAVELYQLGCEYAQGFAFGEPMTSDAARDLLVDKPSRLRAAQDCVGIIVSLKISGVAGFARQHAEIDADLAQGLFIFVSVSWPKISSGSAAQCSQPFC